LIAGRIGATLPANAQGKPGEVLLTLPVTIPRPGQARETVGSQVCLLKSSGALTPVTAGERGVYDMDPCITKDGKTVYYSSDQGGQRGIWKKTVSGLGLSQVDPGRGVDVEPAVFTTSEGVTRVAFTRYSLRAAEGSPPVIVIQEEDRLSFAETQHGRSPAWSNDGTKIAFVSPDNKICVMDSTGENFRVLTSAKSVDDSPIWLPGDRQILYASALTEADARFGTGNYDLWRVDLEGNPQQVVSNPSFDGMPAMTSEALAGAGKTVTFIYFLSNRGAQRDGADAWKIQYFELQ
jgi:dipeptidyl aminopeptidase/acylaminoacyl peptidase